MDEGEEMKKLTQQELDEAIELHGKWLRSKKGGVKLDLSDLDISNLDLTYVDLRFANLRCANLKCVNFTNANLKCANFTNANLRCANFTNADLKCANFTDADLTCANLTRANLKCANFTNADLKCANFTNANLRCAKFIWANFTNANLTNVNLMYANLRFATLTDAKIDYQIQEGLLDQIIEIVLDKPSKLDMHDWHSDCGTAHCLAGWACSLNETAKALEETHEVQIAGLLTLGEEAHSMFFKENEEVLEWMRKKQ